MDKRTQEKFDRIRAKELRTFTEDDIRFLRALRGYLSESELEKYSEVFGFKKKEEIKKPKKTK